MNGRERRRLFGGHYWLKGGIVPEMRVHAQRAADRTGENQRLHEHSASEPCVTTGPPIWSYRHEVVVPSQPREVVS